MTNTKSLGACSTKKTFWLFFLPLILWSVNCGAENYVVEGTMGSQIHYRLTQEVAVRPEIQLLKMSFVVPDSFEAPTCRQNIQGFSISFSPQPDEEEKSRDHRDNNVITAIWEKPIQNIDVQIEFFVNNETRLTRINTSAPYPLDTTPRGAEDYLEPTKQVQADHPTIRNLADEITRDVNTEFDAVQRILTWVVDNVRYVNPPKQYDAIYAVESGKGNCQNFSHLSAALMRASGIPVRIVNGFTLDKPFDITREKGSLTFKMGKGRHSWVEVWFPELGWIPFDPQRTELFVSNRFIRVEIGTDNDETIKDGLVRWARLKGSRARPSLVENINADFKTDKVELKGEPQPYGPKNLLLCPRVEATFEKIKVVAPPPTPVIPKAERKKLRYVAPTVFGNIDFPEDVDFTFARGPVESSGKEQFKMTRNFLVETAEYVTSKLTQYAQVFQTQKPVKVKKIGLALHKYGGNGQIWVEIHEDNAGKPGASIHSSDIIDLGTLTTKPGYRWVDFDFSSSLPTLMPGDYWIALGYTGSPVLNWFYTYGKPVGPIEGTRYKGVFEKDWSKALSYEFNYRVVGTTVK